jgi:catechol 2,3-dioxygenase-like lactoylglutathione lyase family enzyme
MDRVTGIGGVFIKARDPEAIRDWYRRHLGIDVQSWGGATFLWQRPEAPEPDGATVWSIFPASSTYFPGSFMVNYRVPDLPRVLSALREEGCLVDDRIEESEFGKFGWVTDPEGNRIELWEPPTGRFPG